MAQAVSCSKLMCGAIALNALSKGKKASNVHMPSSSLAAISSCREARHMAALISGDVHIRSQKMRDISVRASAATGVEQDIAALDKKFNAEGVKVDSGLGGLPRVVLTSSSGSTAEIYLYGACTTAWTQPSGEDLLFVRPDAVFTGQKPISGGIPHCFPQFGPGEMQQHGFARNLSWEIESTQGGSEPSIVLKLSDNEYTRGMWDFAFENLFKITLGTSTLKTELTVKNLDDKPFEFSAALHSYFRGAIEKVSVKGLKGLTYLNKDPDPKNPIASTETRDEVTFPGFVDCVYLGAPSEVVLNNGLGQTIAIDNKGWSDAVVWSPYLTMEACYKDFVCVENAQIENVKVEAGKSWTAEMTLTPK